MDPQNPFFSFSHNFTNFFIFFKVRLISDSTRSDPSKEPIKIEYLCKNAKKIRNSVTTGPKCLVEYIHLIETIYTIRSDNTVR